MNSKGDVLTNKAPGPAETPAHHAPLRMLHGISLVALQTEKKESNVAHEFASRLATIFNERVELKKKRLKVGSGHYLWLP